MVFLLSMSTWQCSTQIQFFELLILISNAVVFLGVGALLSGELGCCKRSVNAINYCARQNNVPTGVSNAPEKNKHPIVE